LRSRGFYVVANSKINYNLTPYSVASIVNMDYLSLKSPKENKDDLLECFSSINSNPLLFFLKNYKYQIENYSIFRFDDKPPLVNSQFLKVGMDVISSQTFFGRLERDIGFNLITKYKFKWAFKNAAETDIAQIEKLYKKAMAAPLEIQSRPRLIYTHLMMPHYPYYFDKQGNRYDYKMILEENWSLKEEYSEYLQYTNKKLLELFDQILSKSSKPPIIVFMGDHGFREFSSEEKDTKYYFMNMNAIYLPNKNYVNFYDGMSNVNQFRMLLNTVFHQNFSTLKDSSILIN
jgi:arylsulfatase A-like enzyme